MSQSEPAGLSECQRERRLGEVRQAASHRPHTRRETELAGGRGKSGVYKKCKRRDTGKSTRREES